MITTFKIKLKTDTLLKDGTCSIHLVVSKNRLRRRISLNFSCKPNEWDEDYSALNKNFKPAKKRKEINEKIDAVKVKAKKINFHVDSLETEYSLDEFVTKYKGNVSGSVFQFLEKHIEKLISASKISTSDSFKGTRNNLEKFARKSIRFNEITPTFLSDFETFLRNKNKMQDTSISHHLRNLRTLFNSACDLDVVSRDLYPFNKYKISKLNTKTIKRAISKQNILSIASYEPDVNTSEIDSKNMFLFSFHNNGMNFSDIAKLKWTDIIDDRICYSRSTTRGKFSIKISEPVQEILNHYKQFNSGNAYIFPILTVSIEDNPVIVRNKIKNKLKRVNKHLKKIGEACGINMPLTSYVARHSYATILQNNGESVALISQALGHSDIRTTQIYLDSFASEEMDRANEGLLS